MIYSTPSQIVVGIPPNLNTDFFCFVSLFLSFFVVVPAEIFWDSWIFLRTQIMIFN